MKEEKINLIILNNKCNFKKKEYEEYLSSLEKYIEKKSTEKKSSFVQVHVIYVIKNQKR